MALGPQRQTPWLSSSYAPMQMCVWSEKRRKEEEKKGVGGGKQAVADLSFAELFGSHVLILLVKVSIAVHCS